MSTQTAFPELTDVPEYAAEVAKLAELETKKTELEALISRSARAFGHGPGGREAFDQAAADVLAGKPIEAPADVRLDLEQARYELRIVTRAIELQRAAVELARNEAARKLAVQLAPRHKAIGRRLAKALAELAAASQAEIEFRGELDRRQIGALPGLAFTVYNTGSRETLALLNAWLVEHADYLR